MSSHVLKPLRLFVNRVRSADLLVLAARTLDIVWNAVVMFFTAALALLGFKYLGWFGFILVFLVGGIAWHQDSWGRMHGRSR